MTEPSKPNPIPQEQYMPSSEEAVREALASDAPVMPDSIVERLSRVIESEVANRQAAATSAKPDCPNPPTHYDKRGLGMRDVLGSTVDVPEESSSPS